MKNLTTARAFALSAVTALAMPLSANAHHAMDNAIPRTLFEGLVSGLAHPVIGLDHFLFVLAVGIACYYFGRRAGTIASFLAGTLAGTVIHLYKATLAYPDVWVALSLVLLGVLFVTAHRVLKSSAALALFALSGLAHGYAYGEAIVGAEPTPLAAYLAGYALVQVAVAFGGFTLAAYAERRRFSFPALKAAGGALSVAGVVFLVLAMQ